MVFLRPSTPRSLKMTTLSIIHWPRMYLPRMVLNGARRSHQGLDEFRVVKLISAQW